MTVPDWWQAVLLSLAAYRTWRLVAVDDLLDWPRRKLLRLGNWHETGDPVPLGYRKSSGDFLNCGWCAGFWIALAWWGAFQWDSRWTLVATGPWALATLVGSLSKFLVD
jgi:hypothetical protein